MVAEVDRQPRWPAWPAAVVMLVAPSCDEARGPALPPADPPHVSVTTSTTAASASAPRAARSDAASDAGLLPPLAAREPLVELRVEGHGAAVVALPLGARAPLPVLVASHGNYDRPEWQCAEWRAVVGLRAFVLCPRGVARPDSPSPSDVRFTYPSNERLERELGAGLEALRLQYGPYVAEGPVLYAGFSLGAIMGVAIAARQPAAYPRLVLVEGGAEWTWTRAKAFARSGGGRVLFACSQPGCRVAAKEAARKLEAAGAATRLVFVAGLGHSYGGPLNDPIRDAWAWLTEGDARWGPDGQAGAPP